MRARGSDRVSLEEYATGIRRHLRSLGREPTAMMFRQPGRRGNALGDRARNAAITACAPPGPGPSDDPFEERTHTSSGSELRSEHGEAEKYDEPARPGQGDQNDSHQNDEGTQQGNRKAIGEEQIRMPVNPGPCPTQRATHRMPGVGAGSDTAGEGVRHAIQSMTHGWEDATGSGQPADSPSR